MCPKRGIYFKTIPRKGVDYCKKEGIFAEDFPKGGEYFKSISFEKVNYF